MTTKQQETIDELRETKTELLKLLSEKNEIIQNQQKEIDENHSKPTKRD
jgi:hypothetical protein